MATTSRSLIIEQEKIIKSQSKSPRMLISSRLKILAKLRMTIKSL